MKIENEALSGKTVLEIGCGLGRTKRNLVSLLSAQTDTALMVTDVSQQHLDRIREVSPVKLRSSIHNDRCL